MYLVYAVVLALCVLPGARTPVLPSRLQGSRAALLAAALATAAFLCALAVDSLTAERAIGATLLPFAVVSVAGRAHAAASDVAALCALLQCAALVVLALQPATVRADRRVLAGLGACAAIAFLAGLAAPLLRSPDLYAYAGYTLLANPWVPQPAPFAPADAAVAALWGHPIVPAVYGPLWVGVAKLVTLPAHDLLARLYLLRLSSAAAFAACVVLYARMRGAYLALALLACNAAFLDAFVVDGHNDALGVALLLFAAAPARTTTLRVVAVAAAGAVKLPLAVAGSPVFRDGRPLVRAIAACAAVLAAVAATALSGVPLARTIFAQQAGTQIDPAIAAAHALALAGFLAVYAFALFGKRYLRFGGCATLAFGVSPFPWYLLWGLPYALAAGSDAAFLAVLPAVASFADSSHDVTPLRLIVTAAAFGALLVVAIKRPARSVPA